MSYKIPAVLLIVTQSCLYREFGELRSLHFACNLISSSTGPPFRILYWKIILKYLQTFARVWELSSSTVNQLQILVSTGEMRVGWHDFTKNHDRGITQKR